MNNTGLIICGCKNGYSVLSHTDNINPNDADIKNSTKDLRAFIRVNTPLKNFYSIAFTARYAVFTQYRSSVDAAGAAGGYISISVYVPHELQLTAPRQLLNRLTNKYFAEYIHPLFGSPLPGKIESIAPFKNILDQSESLFELRKTRFEVSPSAQTMPPKMIEIADDAACEKVMTNCYHSEYFACQRVMLLPSSFIAEKESAGVVLGEPMTPTTAITHPSLNIIGKIAEPQQPGCTIAKFIRYSGGTPTDVSQSFSRESFDLNDLIEIHFNFANAEPLEFKGTVKQAVDAQLLAMQGKNFSFKHIAYTLTVRINNKMLDTSCLWLRNKRTGMTIPFRNGGFKITSSDSHDLIWSDNPTKGAIITLARDFNSPGASNTIACTEHKYHCNLPNMSGECQIKCPDSRGIIKIPFATDNSGHFSLCLPEAIKAQSLSFEIKGYNCSVGATGGELNFIGKSRQQQNRKPTGNISSWSNATGIAGNTPGGNGNNRSEREKKLKKIIIILVAALLLAVCVGLYFIIWSGDEKEKTDDKVKIDEIETPFVKTDTITRLKIYSISTPFDSVKLTGFPKNATYEMEVEKIIISIPNNTVDKDSISDSAKVELYSGKTPAPAATLPIFELEFTADKDLRKFPENKERMYEIKFPSSKSDLPEHGREDAGGITPSVKENKEETPKVVQPDANAQFKPLMDKLGKMSCTESDVIAARKFYNEHKEVQKIETDAKLKAYETFFKYVKDGSAKYQDVIDNVSHFSAQQQNAIKQLKFTKMKGCSATSFNKINN